MYVSREGIDNVLSDAAVRRLSNQIARAYRGTYGAHTGLRTIAETVTRQMLRAGASPDDVSRAFANLVLNHPVSRIADPRDAETGELHSKTLVELTRQCVSDVAVEERAGR